MILGCRLRDKCCVQRGGKILHLYGSSLYWPMSSILPALSLHVLFITCGEAISDEHLRSTSRFYSPSSSSSNCLISDTRRLVTSRDMYFPGNCAFPVILISQKMLLHGNCEFPGNMPSEKIWQSLKCDITVLLCKEIWLPWKIWITG